MQTLLRRLDELAGIDAATGSVAWLERVVFVFLILMVISAPHSIAATQTAWITGMFLWIVRLFFRPRVKLRVGPLDVVLWAYFLWSAFTSLTSYAPDISINKLRGVAVFLIFYFVFYNLKTRRSAHFIAAALVVSCMVNVLWTPIQRAIGRGVEIHGVAPESPLTKARLMEGDTLLEAEGTKLRTPDDVLSALEQREISRIKFYRPDFEYVVEVKRSDLMGGTGAMERLGISSWKKSHNWRSSGFFGHYTTYSEVLQLIASLVFGLLIAMFGGRREQEANDQPASASRLHVLASPKFLALTFALVAMCVALLLTVTRASQLAFMISGAAIVLVGLGRRWLIAAALVGVPIAIIGLVFLQQSRQVGFFDSKDDSTRWRQTVWQEGFDLWTATPRNFMLGVGMDSIKRFAPEWHLFDDGRLPMGHFHSTPLNLVVERGLPALLIWISVLAIYARSLWRSIGRSASTGILLGCLGGLIGFAISGLVHYNLGDQEVAMIFFLLMGVGVRLAELDDSQAG